MRKRLPTIALLSLLGSACADPGGPSLAAQAGAATSWSEELSQRDRQLQRARARFARTGSWMVAADAAGAAQQRSRLSGDPADVALAGALLAQAFAAAPDGSGPWLAQARLDLAQHRTDKAAEALDALASQEVLLPAQRRALSDARAALDVEQGRLDAAEARWSQHRSFDSTAGLARIAWLRGEAEAADALFVEAGEQYHGRWQEPRAWVALQRGLLDLEYGAPGEALAHFAEADAALPGYWLVYHHTGAALAALGETDAAAAAYQDALEIAAHPETQEALGALRMAQGDLAGGMRLLDAAEAAWAARVEAAPAATAGHAAAFALRWDEQAARGRALAEADARLRPSGPVLAQLAAARLADHDPGGAWDAAQRALETGTRTPAVQRIAAQAAQAAGETIPEENR